MKSDIVISGVGGQGSILASRALAGAAIAKGLNVLTSEVIGMAQREGPVTSHIRIGNNLSGALIPDYAADYLISLELSETVRNLNKLRPGGTVITSKTAIIPTSVQLGLSKYDDEIYVQYIKEQAEKAIFLDLESLSLQAGTPRAGNVVIMGAFSTCPGLPLQGEQILQAILQLVPERYRNINTHAFELGRQAMEEF
ncbi:MAG: indolepyruvate oxidoreductase subunit beta [Peptococcaceae bacterium]|nr:indolepyruvate oxidoreductase subunit beta [Candidatus Syntrophopropionicum ammoniitolerans]